MVGSTLRILNVGDTKLGSCTMRAETSRQDLVAWFAGTGLGRYETDVDDASTMMMHSTMGSVCDDWSFEVVVGFGREVF